MKIYTKTGDAGETGLIGGKRISKDSARISAIGDVDELNAAVGVARTFTVGQPLDGMLESIQCWLFDLGGELASLPGERIQHVVLGERQITELEHSIDEQTAELEPLRNFILPGGSALAARLHLCRSVCRRAERSILALHAAEPVRSEIRAFVNRLSDWLFVSARTANRSLGVTDLEWKSSEG